MKHKVSNPNKGLMWGVMAMAVLVLAVVVVFWFWCFPDGMHARQVPQARYGFCLSAGFQGDSLQLMVNDSVVYSGRPESDSLEVTVSLPEGENLLMVASPEEDRVSSFSLPREGGRIILQKHEGEVEMYSF